MKQWLGTATALAALLVSLGPAAAGADAQTSPSPYCRKVRARAEGDASLLMWPRVFVEGLRFPATGRVDIGATVGDNFQGRAGLSISPLDMVRGAQLLDAADADCAQQASGERLRELFALNLQPETLTALTAQATYLEEQRGFWRELLAKAERRLTAGLIMVVELQELRRFVSTLERKQQAVNSQLARVRATLGSLQKSGSPKEKAPRLAMSRWAPLMDDYVDKVLRLEEEVGSLRALDPWSVRLSAGVIPMPGYPVDWYGFLEVGYALGGIGRNRAEAEYRAARRAELRKETYELPERARELERLVDVEISNASRELEVVEQELATLERTQRLLESADIPQAEHTRSMLAAEAVFLKADGVYFRTLRDALRALRKGRGSS